MGIVSPNVLKEFKEHFDCPSATSVPLENEGTSSTDGSHWERLILGQEVMTGEDQWEAQYSRITLALLEDSGWYEVDYSQADRLDYGRGKGCAFLSNTCHGDDEFSEFCETDNQLGCDANGDKKTACKAQFLQDGCKTWYPYEEVEKGKRCVVI